MYLLDHDGAGSIGVVLNRPTGTPVEEVVPSWGLAVSSPGMIFGGGPVSINGAICIARVGSPPAPAPPAEVDDAGEHRPRFQPVAGPIGTVDLHRPPEDLPVSLAEARVFAGYAGWGPGQLDAEIEEGSWFVVDSADGDVFDADPEGLWPRVLRRQGGWLAVIARHPVDPSVN